MKRREALQTILAGSLAAPALTAPAETVGESTEDPMLVFISVDGWDDGVYEWSEKEKHWDRVLLAEVRERQPPLWFIRGPGWNK